MECSICYFAFYTVRDELDSSVAPPEIPRRPRTPSNDPQRPKTPSENRPKTPTRLALQGGNSRSNASMNPPNSAHLPRRDFFPPENSQDYSHGNENDSFNTSGRPPVGPRTDPFTGTRGRNNFNMPNSYDRDPYGRGESVRPGQFRSRTPGPELMNRSPFPEYRPETNRPKTPTASDMRSKTPIPGLYGQVPGGNPEYSRNNSWGNNSVYRNYDVNSRTWGSSIPENNVTPGMQRRDQSDTFGRMNSSAPVGAGHPPRQSTSFEMENPVPSNVSRVPRRAGFHNASFPGPQSPKPFQYPGNIEDNAKFVEMSVTLQRQESGFGFRIIGGTEEGSQVLFGILILHAI